MFSGGEARMKSVLRKLSWIALAFAAGGIAASLIAVLIFKVCFFGSASPDYRDLVLAGMAQYMFVIGAILACLVAALPQRSLGLFLFPVIVASLVVLML